MANKISDLSAADTPLDADADSVWIEQGGNQRKATVGEFSKTRVYQGRFVREAFGISGSAFEYKYLKLFPKVDNSNGDSTISIMGRVMFCRTNDLAVTVTTDFYLSHSYNDIFHFTQMAGGSDSDSDDRPQVVVVNDGGTDYVALLVDNADGAAISRIYADLIVYERSGNEILTLSAITSATNIHSSLTYNRGKLTADGGGEFVALGESLDQGQVLFRDQNNTIHEFGTDEYNSQSGIILRVRSNPANEDPIFRVLSQGGAERLRVAHNGQTYTANDFKAKNLISENGGTMGSNGTGARTVSTSSPSGGANGDIWLQV